MNEQFPIQPSLEQINEAIIEKVKHAISNPISADRLDEIGVDLEYFGDKHAKNGGLDEEDLAIVKVLEDERHRSSAVSGNITEFRMMLDYLEVRFGPENEWVKTFLAHENAHANVAEETGHNFFGYFLTFIKGDDPKRMNVEIRVETQAQPEWGPEETIRKGIAVILAPEHYGDTLSESDEANWLKAERKLDDLRKDKQQQPQTITND
jgi:hypothetical protein